MALNILLRQQFLSGALVIGAISVETGLLVLNQCILSGGVYKFPYPVVTTLIQCSISFLFIVVAERLSHVLLRHSTPRPLAVSPINNDQDAWLLKDEDAGSDHAEETRRLSPQQIESQSSAGNNRFRDVVSVSVIYLLRIGLSNLTATRLPLSNYLLLRLGAVPILFASNMGSKGPSHSALAGSSAILAILSLSLTILPFTETSTTLTGALVQVIMIVSMSFVDAILPIFLLKACHVTPQTPSAEGLSATDEKDGIEKSPLTTRLRKGSAKFWGTLRHASLLSIVIVVPIFLLCGEVQDIQRNSYVLDVCYLWLELVLSGLLTGLMLIFLSILAKTTSPVAATFLTLPSSAVLLLVFAFGSLSLFGYLGVSLCLAASAVFFGSQIRGSTETAITTKRSTLFLIRNLTIAAVACGCIYAITRGKQATVPSQNFEPICLVGDDIKGGVASHPPLALSAANDGYLGQRPAANTIANIDLIVERCSEVPNGSGIDDVVNCLSFLKDRESEYLILPKVSTGDLEERASGIPELLKHLGEHDSSTSKEESAVGSPAMASTMGVCSGPVIPFHVYWTGPATWRFELFVKAYLYTQNLPCSRLWLWLDSDVDPNAVDEMLCSDPTFQRLRPLVQRGDIVLKSWHFPHRIPIPAETLDNSMAMYSEPRPAAIDNETALADNLVRDTNGQHWLITKPAHAAFSTVQVSDAVRFIVLHLHGGLYCDMDVLLLRDMRPMLLPDPVTGPRAFAEQWVERCGPGDYNTAVISLPANSSLSTYLLRGGVRMGMNFHPRVIGRMAWRDDRNGELAMLHNAVFDPLVTNLRRQGSDTCTVPCHKNFQSSFMRVVDEPWDEWKSYEGEQEPDVVGSFPPTNRSLSTWFRGAWAYHIHNQWWKFPEPTSWMDVITRAQDGFFDGSRTNAYGEWWNGPRVQGYDRDAWF